MLASRKKVVFLGTPAVAKRALDILLEAESLVQVVAVVSQPPARAPRGGGTVPSPVHALALERGIPVLTPDTARDEAFLATLEDLKPDLCVTAAYGNVLPERFLAIPRFGTLNIHPSLLPLYRGAAPVQRALEDGVLESGVTVAFTVRAMDAGPIAAQVRERLDPNVQAPELLLHLFEVGAHLLVRTLPQVFEGSLVPTEQDASAATKAKKISVEEGLLDWQLPAAVLHNKVRAFAGWPGARGRFRVAGEESELKIVTTRLGADTQPTKSECTLRGEALVVVCEDGSCLEVLALQPPGKRVLGAKDFWNGLRLKDVRRI